MGNRTRDLPREETALWKACEFLMSDKGKKVIAEWNSNTHRCVEAVNKYNKLKEK
jgi:hypothetical protein